MALSLRYALLAQGVIGCEAGLLGLNPFYKSAPEGRRYFGFTKLSQIIKALRWPVKFIAGADYPDDDTQGWNANPEGMAHDGVSWYFTNPTSLLTAPISTDFQGLANYHFQDNESPVPLGYGTTYAIPPGGILQINIMTNYTHLGGFTIQQRENDSILYIPVQDGSNTKNIPIIYALQVLPGKSIVDHNWFAPIYTPGDQGAWCAYDPIAHCLYTCDFYGGDDAGNSVDVYSIGSTSDANSGSPADGEAIVLTLIGSIPLYEKNGTPVVFNNIQSGFVTENRHLYMVQDDGTGIVGFDLITGRKQATIYVDYQHKQGILNASYQELEGSCLFSNPPTPGMSGDIHVQLFENLQNDFWIKHYVVSDPADRLYI